MAQSISKAPQKTVWQTLISNRKIILWEVGGIFFINFMGSFLHYAFELSGFATPVAFIASVNESTWEHLKFFFWSGMIYTLIEYTYVKDDANNFAFAKGMGLLVTPLVVCLAFYSYVGVVVPLYGEGTLQGSITTGIIGIIAGQMVSSYYLQSPPLGKKMRNIGAGILVTLTLMFSTFTYFPPKFFLFQDFFGYKFTGQYGILEDYTDYKVFNLPEE
ncbi:MAG: hypothetical protein DWQ04_06605 [Chloroflexi bacterium]|nr:MAG: hypothetical protein DWQ04_06605 [Chloroflexota bacterium]